MKLTEGQKKAIRVEYEKWVEVQYVGKSLKERQSMAQFFTPPDLTIRILEEYSSLDGTFIDPAMGSGSLLAAAICVGVKPKDIYGIELDPDVLELARKRLIGLGVPEDHLHQGNALNMACYEFRDPSGRKDTIYRYDAEKDSVSWDGKDGKVILSFGC